MSYLFLSVSVWFGFTTETLLLLVLWSVLSWTLFTWLSLVYRLLFTGCSPVDIFLGHVFFSSATWHLSILSLALLIVGLHIGYFCLVVILPSKPSLSPLGCGWVRETPSSLTLSITNVAAFHCLLVFLCSVPTMRTVLLGHFLYFRHPHYKIKCRHIPCITWDC